MSLSHIHRNVYCILNATSKFLVAGIIAVTWATQASAQRDLSGAAATRLAIEELNVTGSVLMIGAHPDDENTALLAYFARGRKVRTGYLSLTRGEGGQNLIGSEQGDALGVIRTQELLAARKIDGAEQFFTRAIDFGFTKTAQEALDKWGREKILSDIVWVIRRFRPDVIVLRFSGTPRDGHGQHQASAILGKEAFSAAEDPKRFPEQLKWVQPWRAKRCLWNTFTFNREQERVAAQMKDRIEVDPGDYDPVLGHSYGEIAGMSRSMHRSQGMGAPERKGSQNNYLIVVAGEPAARDIFEGVDTTWDSIPGAAAVARALAQAAREFDDEHPEKVVPLLLKARAAMADLHHPVVERKQRDLDEAIALASGLWMDVTADRYGTIPGGSFRVTRTVLDRGPVPMEFDGKLLPHNIPVTVSDVMPVAPSAPYSQPYWLREPKQGDTYTVSDQTLIGLAENPPLLESKFRVRMDTQEIEFTRPVVYRYIDRVFGESWRPLIVEPAVAVNVPRRAVVFPAGAARNVEIELQDVAPVSGDVRIEASAGWKIEPASQPFQLHDAGEQRTMAFRVTPPNAGAQGTLRAIANAGGKTIDAGMEPIDYPHIPPQMLFPPSATQLVRADIRLEAKNIG